MRFLHSMHLSPIKCLDKLIVSVAIFSALLVQVGCDGSGGVLGSNEQALPILSLLNSVQDSPTAGIGIVPIFKNGELQFITGGTKEAGSSTINFCGYTPTGEIAWEFSAKHGAQNPRPYKSDKINDDQVIVTTAVNIGDIDGDGFDDIYATKLPRLKHLAVISGADGEVIVQSERKSDLREKASPDDIVDLDGDGTKDLRFIFKQESDYLCIALSGKDLSEIEETNFQLPDGQDGSMFIRCLADETGDGIKEILLNVRSHNPNGIEKHQSFVVVDGKTFEIVRSITETSPGRVFRSVQVQSMGDVNGDGVAEFLKYADKGAKSNPENGFVCALDGESGKIIWYIDGGELGGTDRTLTTVPTQTKDAVATHQVNNDLGDFCTVVPDQNGDASHDLVVSVKIDKDAPKRGTLLLISGTDGSILKQQTLQQDRTGPTVISLFDPKAKDQKLTVGVLRKAGRMLDLTVVEL